MKINVSYIGHSGFLVEWENCYWLFDYYKGVIPKLNKNKRLFVFASHKHGDHFNPDILELASEYPDYQYVLSSDIKLPKESNTKIVNTDEIRNHILSVKPSQDYELLDSLQNKILLKTLKSTDCGVAFLLQYQGKTIYHAGDLNLWVWKGESKQYNNNMTAKFQKEMSELKDITIDIAFAPLDPRLEEWYYMGLDQLLNTAKVGYVFPMHFWDKPEIIKQFKQERSLSLNSANVIEVEQEGQMWKLEI